MWIAKLVKLGNSRAVIIPSPIMRLMGWDRETLLEITTDGKNLRITKAQDKGAEINNARRRTKRSI